MSYKKQLHVPKVFIPNKSFHDFEGARRYGELVYLTEGKIQHGYHPNQMARECAEKMADAAAGDYLLLSEPTSINCIATAIMVWRFGKVNFLVYDSNVDQYFTRTLSLKTFYDKETADERL